jgi:hypothetical protein
VSIYKFCEGCEYRVTKYHGARLIGNTCPARFNPFEPMTEKDGTPRTDGREGCPKNLRFMELEEKKNAYASRLK